MSQAYKAYARIIKCYTNSIDRICVVSMQSAMAYGNDELRE
jgi:hypothetical protein